MYSTNLISRHFISGPVYVSSHNSMTTHKTWNVRRHCKKNENLVLLSVNAALTIVLLNGIQSADYNQIGIESELRIENRCEARTKHNWKRKHIHGNRTGRRTGRIEMRLKLSSEL